MRRFRSGAGKEGCRAKAGQGSETAARNVGFQEKMLMFPPLEWALIPLELASLEGSPI